jgi:hypothetical protein
VWYDRRGKPVQMSRYARHSPISYSSFGPGPITPAVKWILIANVAMFVLSLIDSRIIDYLGLIPRTTTRSRAWGEA